MVSICKEINSNKYISPQGSSLYINSKNPGGEFVNNSIDLFYHSFNHPFYSQLYGDFIPYISVIDLLFNEGFSNSLEIIKSGRSKIIHYKNFK